MMNNNNKILTVSYGTFSCTLEGFDDSFGTMKVIAEYFRDLAADDRYFGAEPPQPDAETLARIAQNEVSRRVEAREQDGKIMLSAVEGTVAPDIAAPLAAGAAALMAAGAQAAPQELELDAQDAPIEEDAAVEIEEIAQDDAPVEAVSTDDVADDVEAATSDAPVIEEVADVDEVDVTEAAPTAEIADTGDTTEIEEIEPEQEIDDVETASMDGAIEDDDAAAVSVIATIEEVEPEIEAETIAADEAVVAIEEPVEAAAPSSQHDEFDGDENEAALQSTFVEVEHDIVPGQSDDEVSAFFAGSPSSESVASDDITDAAPLSAAELEPIAAGNPAPDSIAAKLQRIRAVVAQHEDSETTSDYAEDQHADGAASEHEALADDVEEAPEAVSEALADIEDALEADEEADVLAQNAEDDADDMDAILNRLDAQAESAGEDADLTDQGPTNELSDVPLEDAVEEALLQDVAADTVNNIFDEDEPTLASDPDMSAAVANDANPDTRRTRTRLMDAGDAPMAPEMETAGPDQVRRLRTRVIKVKRADLDAAIDKGDLEEYDSADAADAVADGMQGLDDLAPAKNAETTLSVAEQEELARELADLQGEMETDADADADADEITPEVSDIEEQIFEKEPARRVVTSRGLLPNLDDQSGSALDRLMVETDHQMDEPESATRRDAFAHLRAAVAAKKADDSIDGNGPGRDGDDVYREDLAEVVRPRRPISGPPVADHEGDQRPAPLKLVAEQRIPSEEDHAEGPVQPRRVVSVGIPVAAPQQDSAFAKYAAETGATSLPQLLEAAAAFMCFVEGREQFSRPQLMTKVREVGGQDGFSREEGLRSFGQLLRAGKIEKLRGGRFTVSEDIGFRPDERAFG